MPDSIAPLSAPRVALVGFGEAGEAFARAEGWRGHDTRLGHPARAPGGDGAGGGPRPRTMPAPRWPTAPSCSRWSPPTRRSPRRATTPPLLPEARLWCDMNSVAPETKREAAAAIEAAGGRYVDVAVMAPVHPARLARAAAGQRRRTPIAAQPLLERSASATSASSASESARASAIKMIRSVMVKGIEALTAECFLAAEAAGVLDEVVASLDASWPGADWAERADYNLERMASMALRRAAEMEEVGQDARGARRRAGDDPRHRRAASARVGRAGPAAQRRTRGGMTLIIDCHGHYTTAPAAARRLARRAEGRVQGRRGAAALPGHLRRRDPRDASRQNQLRLITRARRRHDDLLARAPRRWRHHVGDEAVAKAWARADNDLIARVRRALSRDLRRRLHAAAEPEGRPGRLDRGAGALRRPSSASSAATSTPIPAAAISRTRR